MAVKCPNPNPGYREQPRFFTRSGWLKPYALACGYIHVHEVGSIRTTLQMEHGALHVRQYDYDTGEGLCWETYIPSEGPGRYEAARRRYARAVREARKVARERGEEGA